MMYFANLDAAIRSASGGRRNLLSALRPLFEARLAGQSITPARWDAWLERERGPEAVRSFHRTVLDGELIEPSPQAFGSRLEALRASWTDKDGPRSGYVWRTRASD